MRLQPITTPSRYAVFWETQPSKREMLVTAETSQGHQFRHTFSTPGVYRLTVFYAGAGTGTLGGSINRTWKRVLGGLQGTPENPASGTITLKLESGDYIYMYTDGVADEGVGWVIVEPIPAYVPPL